MIETDRQANPPKTIANNFESNGRFDRFVMLEPTEPSKQERTFGQLLALPRDTWHEVHTHHPFSHQSRYHAIHWHEVHARRPFSYQESSRPKKGQVGSLNSQNPFGADLVQPVQRVPRVNELAHSRRVAERPRRLDAQQGVGRESANESDECPLLALQRFYFIGR